jgi:hypothetical protein
VYANCGNYPPFLKKHGLYFSQAIIWNKMHPVLTRKDFMGAHEWAFYGWNEGAGHKYYGPNNETDLWNVKKIPPQQLEHLTGKPAELAVRSIQYSSLPGQNVLDLFGGSGSTLIGAEQTGRKPSHSALCAPANAPHSFIPIPCNGVSCNDLSLSSHDATLSIHPTIRPTACGPAIDPTLQLRFGIR